MPPSQRRPHSATIAVVVAVVGSVVLPACSDESAAVEPLVEAAFEDRTDRICTDHAEELERRFDTTFNMWMEGKEDLDAEVERMRRDLLVLKRDLIAELRRIEPSGREFGWRAALDGLEKALQRSGAGARVDVHAEGLDESVTRLIEDFALDACF